MISQPIIGQGTFRLRNILRTVSSGLIACALVLSHPLLALASAGTFDVGPDSTYVEEGSAVSIFPDFTMSDASQNYAGGSVTFSVDGTNESGETLAFSSSTPSIVDDVISVQGTTVFKGDGTTANAIGNIDGTLDGDGNDLKVVFSNTFENGNFSNGSTGWTISNSRVNLGYINSGTAVASTSTIAGFAPPIDYTWGPGASNTSQWDRTSAPNTFTSTSSGNLTMGVNGASCSIGFCVIRGPYVVSNASVYLNTGVEISFDWSASASGDAFDVYGYLVNTSNGKVMKLIDETGRDSQASSGQVNVEIGTARNETGYFSSGTRRTDLKTYSVGSSSSTTGASRYDDRVFTDGTSFTPGNYKFVFIAGTYDDSGGRYLGATFTIDNVTVSSTSEAVTAADIQALARLVTYANTTGQQTSRTLTFASSNSDTAVSGGDTKIVSVTQNNDAPVFATPATVSYTDTSAVDSFSTATATLSATDEEGDSITYGISGVTPSSGSSVSVGTYGTLTVTAAGSLSYVPVAAALNALDSGTSETFTLTASDGNSVSTAVFTVSISATTDALPSAPTIVSTAVDDGQVKVTFSPPQSSGTSSITNYMYSTDGTNYVAMSPATTASPLTISALSTDGTTPLTNGTTYPITLKAVNSTGSSPASNSVTATPAPPPSPAPASTSAPAIQTPIVAPRVPRSAIVPAPVSDEPAPIPPVPANPLPPPVAEVPADPTPEAPLEEPPVSVTIASFLSDPIAIFSVAQQLGEPVPNTAIGASGDDSIIVAFDPVGTPEAVKATNNLVGATAAVAGVAAAAGAAGAAAAAAGAAAGAAGAAAGAAGSAGAAASSASAAGSAGGAASGGGTGAGGGGGSTASAGAEMTEDVLDAMAGADYEVSRIRATAKKWGDRWALWRWKIGNFWDGPSTKLTLAVAPGSPLLAKLLNDGSYLRAIAGPLALALPIVGVGLALESLELNQGALLHPPVALYLWLVILGIFDAFAGSLAMTVFILGSLPLMDFSSITDWRMLAGIVVSGFGPIVIARSIRDFRRPAPRSGREWLTRIGDIAFASLMGGWVAGLIIRSLPALTGLTLPAANYVLTFQIYATLAIALRIVVEDVAARFFPQRLDELTPDSLPSPPPAQIVFAQVLRFAFYIFIASAFMGFGPIVWFAALLFMVPTLMGYFSDKLPNSRLLWRLLPTGLAGLAMMLGLEIVLENTLSSIWGDHPSFSVIFIFALLSLIIVVALLGMMAREGAPREEHWLQTSRFGVVKTVGAVAVFLLLIQFTSML